MERVTRVTRASLDERRAAVNHGNAVHSWTSREGIVLSLHAGTAVGAGEASPLPGYSRDDLTTCRRELDAACSLLEGFEVPSDPRAALRAAVEASRARAPAAIFAIETAVLDLLARESAKPAWALLRGDDLAEPIPLSALAEGARAEDLAESAAAALDRGIAAVKIKVGGEGNDARDRERLTVVRKRVGDRVALRLDANQTFAPDEVERRVETLAAFAPELIEEPTQTAHWPSLSRSTARFAMDESLAHDGWRARLAICAARGSCSAVVLKPTALGGILRCLDIAEAAAELGLASIVTHTFDGPIASTAAACLALALRGPILPCGLDSHARLERPVASIERTRIVPFTEHGIGTTP